VTIAFSLTAVCHRMFSTLKSTGVGHFGAKFGEERVDRCKLNFNAIWQAHGAVVCKRNCVDIFCRLSTMHERDRQTDRQTETNNQANGRQNGNIDTNWAEIAFSDVA